MCSYSPHGIPDDVRWGKPSVQQLNNSAAYPLVICDRPSTEKLRLTSWQLRIPDNCRLTAMELEKLKLHPMHSPCGVTPIVLPAPMLPHSCMYLGQHGCIVQLHPMHSPCGVTPMLPVLQCYPMHVPAGVMMSRVRTIKIPHACSCAPGLGHDAAAAPSGQRPQRPS